ncbi:hypothetical protein OAA59_00885 [bacterium]|nr:hypothetical protein [bacterium]
MKHILLTTIAAVLLVGGGTVVSRYFHLKYKQLFYDESISHFVC